MDSLVSERNPMLFYWPIINLVLLLIILVISIYFVSLAVKAIKIYIKKNS